MSKKLSGLGRGLGALIPQRPQTPPQASQPTSQMQRRDAAMPADNAAVRPNAGVLHVPVATIEANPEQPRVAFRHQELEDLMNSIKEHGILQPLTVSPRAGGGYELIAGERRLRAAKMLGLPTVPVLVRTVAAHDKLLLALIENIQREDLNVLEEARGYERLSSEFGLTQEQISKQVGKARSTVANAMRLLELPDEIKDAIAAGAVSAGSARAMLSLPDVESQIAFFRKLVADRLTTREAEAGVRRAGVRARKDAVIIADEERLREKLGTRVEIKKRGGKGTVVISFYSDEEYAALLGKLDK